MKFFYLQIIFLLAIASAIDASNKKSKSKNHKSNESTVTNKEVILTNEIMDLTKNKASKSSQCLSENIKPQQKTTKTNESNKKSLNVEPSTLQSQMDNTNNVKKEIITTNANKTKINSSNEVPLLMNKVEPNSANDPQMKTTQPNESRKISINNSSPPGAENTNENLKNSKSKILQNKIRGIETSPEEINEKIEKLKITQTNDSSENASTSRTVKRNKNKQKIWNKTATENSLANNNSEKLKLKSIEQNETSDKFAKSSPELSEKTSTSRIVKRNKNKQKIWNDKTATENSSANNNSEKLKLKSIEQNETPDKSVESSPELFLNIEVKGWKEKSLKYAQEIENAEEQISLSYQQQLMEKIDKAKQTENNEVHDWRISLDEIKSGLASIAYAKDCSLMRLDLENWKKWTPYQKYIASEEIITWDTTYIMAALEDYMYMGYFDDTSKARDELIGGRENIISEEYFEFREEMAKESSKQKRMKENRDHVCKKRNGQYTTANEICDALRKLFFWKGQDKVECHRAYVNNNPSWGQEHVALCKLEWPKKGAMRFINDPFTGMILDAAKAGPDITLGIMDGKFPHGFWLAAVLTEREPYRVKIINELTYVKNTQMAIKLPTALEGIMEGALTSSGFELYKPDGLSRIDAAHKVVEWVVLRKDGSMFDPETGVFSSYMRQREKKLKGKEKIQKLFSKK